MCGFVAQISKGRARADLSTIQRMNARILHRGPDDEGYFIQDWIGLGFRRLAIIDLSQHGHQPMHDSTGRYICVFNGEIYNYIELKKELQAQGVVFHTASDTEVLLQAYIHWGQACLTKFIGMFAFIVVDLQEQSVFLARDFPGIKPLYFAEDKDYYYFASEVKAFKHIVPFSLNEAALAEQFNYRYLAGDRTLLKGIIKVLPGFYWKIEQCAANSIHKNSYFNLRQTFYKSPSRLNFKDTVAQIEAELRESFLLHTRSDVGFCVQLSGGVDSSLMMAMLSKHVKELHTFSITLDEPRYDESTYQREVVQRYGGMHHSFNMTAQDYADNLELATYHMDAPIVHSGCVFLMKLCQHIQSTSKVVLIGGGADELFGGYAQHDPSPLKNLIFRLQKMGITGRGLPNLPKIRTLKNRLQHHFVMTQTQYQPLQFFDHLFNLKNVVSEQRLQYANLMDEDYATAVLAYDQNTYLTSMLDRQDRLSMAHSIEARVPFCNQKLYGLVNPLTRNYKFKQGERKALLKKCAEPYLSSDSIYRRKNGLKLPLAQWYRDAKTVGRYLDLLTDQTAKERGLYNNPAVEQMVAQFRQGQDRYTKPIVSLVNFEIWCRSFLN